MGVPEVDHPVLVPAVGQVAYRNRLVHGRSHVAHGKASRNDNISPRPDPPRAQNTHQTSHQLHHHAWAPAPSTACPSPASAQSAYPTATHPWPPAPSVPARSSPAHPVASRTHAAISACAPPPASKQSATSAQSPHTRYWRKAGGR